MGEMNRQTAPLFIALSADVDADANRPLPGVPGAVSTAPDASGRPAARFEACFEGLAAWTELIEQAALPATLFWEGRAVERLLQADPALEARLAAQARFEHGCHGYEHEDSAGAETGLPLDLEQTLDALARAGSALAAAFGAPPRGFRAPYCRLTENLNDALVRLGYDYDASLTREPSPSWRLTPYPLAGGVTELPLCRARDRRGRPMSGYLWQLLEGRRPVEDYIEMIERLRSSCAGGLLHIAIHPWHLVVRADGRPMGPARRRRALEDVRRLLEAVRQAAGVRPCTAGDYLRGPGGT